MRAALSDLRAELASWQAAARGRPGAAVLVGLLALVLGWVYGAMVFGLLSRAATNVLWWHCFLVPPAAGWIWLQTRPRRASLPVAPWWGGGAALLLLAGVLLVGELGAGGFFFGGASLVCAVGALVALLAGRERFRGSLFPLGFLLIGIPLPLEVVGALGFPLQHISAAGTQVVCRLMGLPVLRDGVVLTLGDFSATIAGSCSGMNSLFALAMVSVWVLGFSGLHFSRRVWIAVAILPAVLIANITRLVLMEAVALLFGGSVAMSFFHEGSDIVLFLIVLTFLLSIRYRLEAGPPALRPGPPPAPIAWIWEPSHAPNQP